MLQADGGTRTASITGACVAVAMAFRAWQARGELKANPLKELVAAVSVGLVNGRPVLDLDYVEDKDAAVDMNVVLTAGGRFVEVQGAGEEATFSPEEFSALVDLGRRGVAHLVEQQRAALV